MKKLNLNTIAIKFKEIYRQEDNFLFYKISVSILFILGLTAFLVQFQTPKSLEKKNNTNDTMDTYIPENHRLLTIEIMNYESLDQIIGQYGVVDLYAEPLITGKKARLVMSQVKLIRNLKSPRHFNVLLEPQDVPLLASQSGEYIASIRNPKFIGTKIVKEKSLKRNIFFDEGSL